MAIIWPMGYMVHNYELIYNLPGCLQYLSVSLKNAGSGYHYGAAREQWAV
jgi:hypothetical protein